MLNSIFLEIQYSLFLFIYKNRLTRRNIRHFFIKYSWYISMLDLKQN